MENKQVIGRFKYIAANAEFLIRILRNGCIMDKVLNPLPEDTQFVRGGNDAMGNMYIVIQSQSFEELKENDEIPFYGHILFEKAFPDSKEGKH
jgi:hypothetical protein